MPSEDSNASLAIWYNPLAYDLMQMGPPYLPEPRKVMTKAAALDVFQTLLLPYTGQAAELGAVLACLRAAAQFHQSHHWRTRGGNFYGDHLLFERIYNDSLGFIDQVAERAIGSGNRGLVDPLVQAGQIHSLMSVWCPSATEPTSFEMVANSLVVERCVLSCLTQARAGLEAKGQLSDGTDNLLQGVADKHEEFVYLLQQREGGRIASFYSYDRSNS